MRGRKPSPQSDYYLPSRQYQYAVSFALMRDDWKAEIKSLENQAKAIRYDKDKVQSSPGYDPTEAAALEIYEIKRKVDLIDETIEEVSEGMDAFIKLAVCNGFTYTQLTTGRHHMPLNHIAFGKIKHKFYYQLYQKI